MKGSYIFNDVIDFSKIGSTGDFISKIPFLSKNTRFDSLDIDVSSGVVRYNNIDVYNAQGWTNQKYRNITFFEPQEDDEYKPSKTSVYDWLVSNSTKVTTKKKVKLTKTKENGTADEEEVYPQTYVTQLLNEDGSQWIPSLGGSGGMSGEGSSAVSITTITEPELTTSLGVKTELEFEWSSEADGNGTLYIYVDGELKKTTLAKQGKVKVDVSNYITSATEYHVRLVIEDSFGSKRALNYQVTAISLIVNSTFDQTQAYTGEITYRYIPYGDVKKTIHFFVDGVEYTQEVETSGREQTFTLPTTLSHGVHTLKVYATATFGETTVYSNEINYKFAYYQEGNSTPIIVIFNEPNQTFDEGQTVKINYLVYTATSETTDITLYLNGQSQSLTVDRQAKVWSIIDYTIGINTIKIATDTNYETTTFNIVASEITITPVTTGLQLFLTSNGKSNNVISRNEWTYNNITTTFNNFNFVSDGWLEDSDRIVGLKMTGDANIEINYKPFGDDAKVNGKTIELEFATSKVTNFDATVINIMSVDRGLIVKPNEIVFKSLGKEISTRFKEEEHIRVAIVIERSTSNKFISTYINGVLSGIDVYGDSDDFEQTTPVNIKAGSTECDLTLYKIRVYNNDLTAVNILDNYIADNDNYDLKTKLYRRNKIYDAYGNVLYTKVKTIMPVLLITAPILPSAKDEVQKLTTLKLENINNPQLNWEYTNLDFEIQGTSSVQYPVKNLEFKFGEDVIQLYPDAIPENRLTLKVDYASSAGVFNIGNAKIVNGIYQEKNPRQQDDSRVRNALYGYPVAVFYRRTPSDNWQFYSKGSLNLSKKANALGYKEGDESWEVKNNTSPLCLFDSNDFSTLSSDFEYRYNKSGSSANLEALISWVYSCKGNPTKFRNECEEHFNLHYLLMYYVYGQIMGGADSYAKNLYLGFFASSKNADGTYNGKWYPEFYDLDTSYGIDNTGRLKFEYSTELNDKVEDRYAFNGHDSVLWNLVQEAYADELKTLYQTLRNGEYVTYDTIMKVLQAQGIEQYPEAIYNEDAEIKYITPYLEDGENYLSTALGSTLEHLKYWVHNRLKYLDSKWIASEYSKDRIVTRITTPDNVTPDYSITLKSRNDMYMQVQYGSYYANQRAMRNTQYTLTPEIPTGTVFNDTEAYIYGASTLTSVGDLSKWYVTFLDISKATALTEIKVGDSAANYSNANLKEFTAGANILLRKVDLTNCTGLTGDIDLSLCTNLQELYASGTQITSFKFANGGKLKLAYLPDTITSLELINLVSIQNLFTTGEYTKIRIENSNVDSLDYVNKSIAANKLERLRLYGINWTIESKDMLNYLVENVKGINSIGNNQDKSVLAGNIHIAGDIYSDEITAFREYWGTSLEITADNIIQRYRCRFYDYDGTLLYQTSVYKGESVAYIGRTPYRPINEATKTGYVFIGWDKSQNNIKADTDFRPVFDERPMLKATFVDYQGNEICFDEVISGTKAEYKGEVPTKPRDYDLQIKYEFKEWYPNINEPITDNTTFTPVFDEINFYKVEWKNYDGAVLETDYVDYGDKATYEGETPTRPTDTQYVYTFSGWSPNPENTTITSNTTFTAGYSLKALCKVTLLNADGSVFDELGIGNGESFTYHSTPTPPEDDAQFSDYQFASWQLNGVDVTLPITVTSNITLTPRFEGTLRKYSVFWYVNGELMETDVGVDYGTIGVSYDGVTPTTPNESEVFKGWALTPDAEEVINITTYQVIGDTNLYAIFGVEEGITLTMMWDNAPTTDLNLNISVNKKFVGDLANEYVTIDWGDGTLENIKDITTYHPNNLSVYKSVTHSVSNYVAGQEYKIRILKVGEKYEFSGASFPSSTGTILQNNKEALREAKVSTYLEYSFYMFTKCTNLLKLSLDNKITKLGEKFCSDCTKLSEIKLPNNLQEIGDSALRNTALSGEFIIPDSVTFIAGDAFFKTKITTLKLPSNLSGFGSGMLNRMVNLKTLILGSNTNLIPSNNNTSLYSTTSDTGSLEEIICPPENPYVQVIDNVLYTKDGKTLLLYPSKKTDTIVNLPTTLETIWSFSCLSNNISKTINFPENLKIIRTSAFYKNKVTNPLIFNDKLETIEASAFFESGISIVTFGNNPINITGNNTFYKQSSYGANQIRLKGGLTQWLNSNIPNDTSLSSLSNKASLFVLNSNNEWEALREITIPNEITQVRKNAFYNMNVTKVNLHNNITYLGANCFGGTNITEIIIPEGVTSLAGDQSSYGRCFVNCENLQKAIIPNSVTLIGGECFNACTALTEIIIGNGVTNIYTQAFRTDKAVLNRIVVIKAGTPPTIASDAFTSSYFNSSNGCKIKVPTESVDAYKAASNWSAFADIIEGGAENHV